MLSDVDCVIVSTFQKCHILLQYTSKKGLKMANFHGLETPTPSGMLFWVDLKGSLPLKPISNMDLGYCVQMNPYNTF